MTQEGSNVALLLINQNLCEVSVQHFDRKNKMYEKEHNNSLVLQAFTTHPNITNPDICNKN